MISTQDTPKSAYLRHRPFLVVDYYTVPAITGKGAGHTRTERKGWMTIKENTSIEAYPQIVDRVTDKHMVQASVIIDVLGDKVIKNRLSDSNDEVLTEFKSKYREIIERGRNVWFGKTTAQYRNNEALRQSHKHSSSDGQHKAAHTPDAFLPTSRKV